MPTHTQPNNMRIKKERVRRIESNQLNDTQTDKWIASQQFVLLQV